MKPSKNRVFYHFLNFRILTRTKSLSRPTLNIIRHSWTIGKHKDRSQHDPRHNPTMFWMSICNPYSLQSSLIVTVLLPFCLFNFFFDFSEVSIFEFNIWIIQNRKFWFYIMDGAPEDVGHHRARGVLSVCMCVLVKLTRGDFEHHRYIRFYAPLHRHFITLTLPDSDFQNYSEFRGHV